MDIHIRVPSIGLRGSWSSMTRKGTDDQRKLWMKKKVLHQSTKYSDVKVVSHRNRTKKREPTRRHAPLNKT